MSGLAYLQLAVVLLALAVIGTGVQVVVLYRRVRRLEWVHMAALHAWITTLSPSPERDELLALTKQEQEKQS